jgi:hypothetical protein
MYLLMFFVDTHVNTYVVKHEVLFVKMITKKGLQNYIRIVTKHHYF